MNTVRGRQIDPQKFGVSFSLKQCRSFGIDPRETFRWLVNEAGFRRFRVMSYWNEHEKKPGEYDFSALDWQIQEAANEGCLVTLCLGARQPRWPENHWPDWAWKMPKKQRSEALLRFIQKVVERYRAYDAVVSYQLENEALLRSFGRRPEIDRKRLRQEYSLIKKLDLERPVIMSTSDFWGVPLRKPRPDIVGFSYYHVVHTKRGYRSANHHAWLHRLRAQAIRHVLRRPSFIHELQLEPWGPNAIWKMTVKEQDKSMGIGQIQKNIALARKTGLYPIDLWGGEWWYWRYKSVQDPSIWLTVQSSLILQ
jgi:glycosyl hydrolase family 42 (putative beta-galactosidase)